MLLLIHSPPHLVVHGNPNFEHEQPVHIKPALFGFSQLHFISWSMYFSACSLSVMIAVMLLFLSLKKPNFSNSNNCRKCFHMLIWRYTRAYENRMLDLLMAFELLVYTSVNCTLFCVLDLVTFAFAATFPYRLI